VSVGPVGLSINAMLFALFTAIVGLQLFLVGAIAQSLYDGTGRKRRRWLTLFPYTRTTLIAAGFFIAGLGLVARFIQGFVAQGFLFSPVLVHLNHYAVFGLFLMMASALVFVSMLVMQAVAIYIPLSHDASMKAPAWLAKDA
jgi:hypothetical protein